MIAPVVVVLYKRGDLSFKVAGQVVVLQQDAVLERLVPALDLTLSLWMVRSTAHMAHVLAAKPMCQFSGDIAGTII